MMRRSAFAQWTFDRWLGTSSRTGWGKIRWKLCGQLRSALVRICDPIVSYEFEGARLALPLSHELPRFRKLFPEYSANLARIAAHVLAKYPDLHFIDVGANIGDTVALLRNLAPIPILCIEGSERYFEILRANYAGAPDIVLGKAFLDATTGSTQGSLKESIGTAHLARAVSDGETTPTTTLDDFLKDHPRFSTSKMLKVDTDGFDARILRGALQFISAAKPVIHFEYDPYFLAMQNEPALSVFANLRAAGYSCALVHDNLGDYQLTIDLKNEALLEDLHQYYSGRRSARYADVCAFHEEDADLCAAIRVAEISYFNRVRTGA